MLFLEYYLILHSLMLITTVQCVIWLEYVRQVLTALEVETVKDAVLENSLRSIQMVDQLLLLHALRGKF